MTELPDLMAALAKHRPAEVRLYQGEELSRTIEPNVRRKRWKEAVAEVAGKLRWTSIELVDAKGATLAVIDQPVEAEPEMPLPSSRDAALLGLMLRAQREALSYREREAAAALKACVEVMQHTTSAVATLAKVHEVQLAAVRQARAAAPRAEEVDDFDDAMGLLQTIAPALLGKMLGAGEAPAGGGVMVQLTDDQAKLLARFMGASAPAAETPVNGARKDKP